MKTCARCHESKNESEFCLQKAGTDQRDSYCKVCRTEMRRLRRLQDPDRENELAQQYRKRNKDRLPAIKKSQRKRDKDKKINWLRENFKVECLVCGFDKSFSALDAHHLDDSEKESKLDSMGVWFQYGMENFIKKIESTHFVFLCSNCHRMLHAGEITLEGTL